MLVVVYRAACQQESSNCYSDIDSCFWTDGSRLTQYEAQTACQRRHNSFVPRVTDDNVQSQLADFLSWTRQWYFSDHGSFWIDARSVSADGFHWINGPALAGLL